MHYLQEEGTVRQVLFLCLKSERVDALHDNRLGNKRRTPEDGSNEKQNYTDRFGAAHSGPFLFNQSIETLENAAKRASFDSKRIVLMTCYTFVCFD